MDAVDDTELVTRAKAGDSERLASLWARHQPRVLATARAILGDDEAAAEVAQETALVALTDLGQLRDPSVVGAWLAGIARNLCRRRLRARKEWSWEAIHGGRLPPPATDPAAGPDEVAVRAETSARIRLAVDALPTGQRDAVRLFYLEDRNHREVAESLGIDVNAVKARLHRARRSLRPLVAAEAPGVPRDPRKETDMVSTDKLETRIRDVRRRIVDGDEKHVVLLETSQGEQLRIWVGPSEAIALALQLTGTQVPRPLTHEAMARLVEAAGGRIGEVAVTRLEQGTFFAEVTVHGSEGTSTIDLRPSDALNIALAVDAKVTVVRSVLDAASAVESTMEDYPDDFETAYPDDAATIATEIVNEWAQQSWCSAEASPAD